MEAKDYTNIAGSPFQPYVKDQINIRKEIINKENRTPSDLLWLTNRNSWIRISSGVNVKDDNPYFPNERGNILSKKYILQAGLVDHTGGNTSYQLRSSISSNGAYGIGGTDFGYKPMPGLENLSIKTGGRLGTLREATFDFTCYNMEQLDIMNALYMKLGFSVLIEWGHIPFLDNKGVLNTNPIPIEFYGIETKEELMTTIQKKRVDHSGNYDAMWGTIKNFSYSYGENGEFKCKVDLVGAGDILESLKINQSGTAQGSSGSILVDSEYPVVADSNKSLLNEALYVYYNAAKDSPNNPYILKSTLTTYFSKLKINFEDFTQNTDLIKKGFQYSLLSKLNENNGGNVVNIPDIYNPEYYFSNFILNLESDGDAETPAEVQVYITLGHLLLLTLTTGGIYDKKNSEDNPYIYIDVNNETNRCYTFPGHCSLDPTVCLIGSEGIPFGIESEIFSKNIQPNFPFYDPGFPELGGRFMWTLVNIDFIVKTLRKYTSSDPKGDINFVDFAQDILTSISKACGGFNEFRIVPDDDTRCVRIFDDRVVPNFEYETSKYLTIPVLGKNSVVHNFNYTSKISPQMATQIVIAAQAQDKGIQGNKNSLAFSHLNEGLENRLSPSRGDAVENLNSEAPGDSTLSKYLELRTLLEKIYGGFGVSLATTEDVVDPPVKNLYGDILPTTLTLNKDKPELNRDIFNNVLDNLIKKLTSSKIKPDSTELKALDDAKKAVQTLINTGKLNIDNLKTIKAFNQDYTETGDLQITLIEVNSYIAESLDAAYESPNSNYGIEYDSDLEEEWQKLLENEGGGPGRTSINF